MLIAHLFAFTTTVYSKPESIRAHLVDFALVESFWFPPSPLPSSVIFLVSVLLGCMGWSGQDSNSTMSLVRRSQLQEI